LPKTIVKTIVLLASKGARKIFWYQFYDSYRANPDPADSEQWFGLYSAQSDGTLVSKGFLPDAYKLCAEYIPGTTWRAAGLPGLDLGATVQANYFEGSDGRRVLVVWNDNLLTAPLVDITLPGTGHVLHSIKDGTSAPVPASGSYQLTKRDAPDEQVLFFTWTAE
ncbi:MAG: hypothetical protein FWF29_09620, partial [Treponema sp.]|nr:hypothetical protein [Treponema sp.]